MTLFFQEQLPLRAAATSTNLSQSTVANNMVDSNKSDVIELTEICDKKFHSSTDQILRKRSSKRDRHSKINTAQGPRDRRMRLSLKVAREFFDLQDKLSFDKASKTVEWLLVQAKSEIKKLSSGASPHMCYSGSAGTKNASSTSECEMLSEMNAETTTKGRNVSNKGRSSPCAKKERRARRPSSRKTPLNPFAKESREKARARARERTKEKLCSRRIDELKFSEESSNNELNHFAGCWDTPLETGDQHSGIQNFNPSLEVQLAAEVDAAIYHEQEKLGTTEVLIDEELVIMSKYWSPSFPNHLYNTGTPQEIPDDPTYVIGCSINSQTYNTKHGIRHAPLTACASMDTHLFPPPLSSQVDKHLKKTMYGHVYHIYKCVCSLCIRRFSSDLLCQ
ncbi:TRANSCRIPTION FACTOR TCP18 [Salix viminalis]|uniref:TRANSCRIPTION FACTOR TCP18 n=1 Tax=Salix viminalis TaxID=40686 RepID=A0A9Q0SD86_SALVM|nr:TRANSCRIPTION FACTOR TCP18 [Salix viminalis]